MKKLRKVFCYCGSKMLFDPVNEEWLCECGFISKNEGGT